MAKSREKRPTDLSSPAVGPSLEEQTALVLDEREKRMVESEVKKQLSAKRPDGKLKRGRKSKKDVKEKEELTQKVTQEFAAKKVRAEQASAAESPKERVQRQLNEVKAKLRRQFEADRARANDVKHPLIGLSINEILAEQTHDWDKLCKGKAKSLTGYPPYMLEMFFRKYGSSIFTEKQQLVVFYYLFRKPLKTALSDPFTFDLSSDKCRDMLNEGLMYCGLFLNEVQLVSDRRIEDEFNHAPLLPASTMLIDVFPVPVSRSYLYAANWSGYYKRPVLKFQMGTNKYGLIVFFTGGHAGAIPDSHLWGTSSTSAFAHQPNLVPDGDVVLADGAYAGAKQCVTGSRCYSRKGDENRRVPIPDCNLPVAAQKMYNGSHGFVRGRVERGNARVKDFKILTYPYHLGGEGDSQFLALCGRVVAELHNFLYKYGLPELPIGPYRNLVAGLIPQKPRTASRVVTGEPEAGSAPPAASATIDTEEDDASVDDEDEFGLRDVDVTPWMQEVQGVLDCFPENGSGETPDVVDKLLQSTAGNDPDADWHEFSGSA